MGEAKRREDAVAAAAGAAARLNAQPKTAVDLHSVAVCLALDTASGVLFGLASQLQGPLQSPEEAALLMRSAEHLRAYRMRYLANAAGKVVLATAADVPRVQL